MQHQQQRSRRCGGGDGSGMVMRERWLKVLKEAEVAEIETVLGFRLSLWLLNVFWARHYCWIDWVGCGGEGGALIDLFMVRWQIKEVDL